MKKLLTTLTFVLIFSCYPNDEEEICDTSPSFSSISSPDISDTSFKLRGSINISDCDKDLRLFGIVYSTSELLTRSDQKKYFYENDFSFVIQNIVPDTKYYVRASLNKLDDQFDGNQVVISTLQQRVFKIKQTLSAIVFRS